MIGRSKAPQKARPRHVDRDAAYRTIAKRLRWLLDFERSAAFSLDRWEWESRKLQAFMIKWDLEMDEAYWHYMSDADIRQRGSEAPYAEQQRQALLALIEELEASPPGSD